MKNKIIKNIPNALTTSRIISSIVGAISFILGNYYLSFGTYIYGAISDFFDGFAARKLNAYSELGRKLDAVSDKLFALSLLAPSIICGNILMIIPLLYEIKIAHTNYKSEKLGFKPATIRLGKFKTAMLFPTIITGLLATIKPELYYLLGALLPITTVLQSKTATMYENILNDNIEGKTINYDLQPTYKNTNAIDKVKDLSNEFTYHLCTPITKNKVKKRVLKK